MCCLTLAYLFRFRFLICILLTNYMHNYLFFFYKQKTAYEMRISYWSSDVSSSVLTALAGQFDNGLACDAIEEAVWRRRVDFAVADEEGVCASRFSHLPAPVEHQRIVETAISRVMLRHGCDHVQPRCLCLSLSGIGSRPPQIGRAHAGTPVTNA